jgi:hypothetical protein
VPVPKTLLLTPAIPGNGSVGQKFLRELALLFPRDRLVCYTLGVKYIGFTDDCSEDLKWMPVATREFGSDRYVSGSLPQWLKPFASFWFQSRKESEAQRLASEIAAFGRMHGVESVLTVLGSPTLIRVSSCLAGSLKVKLVPIIWDPPDSEFRIMEIDSFSSARLMRRFEDVMRSSTACGAASDAMAQEYSQQFGLPCKALIRSVAHEERRINARVSGDQHRPFVIGFAGSAYARDSIKWFLDTLSANNWQIGDRNIKFKAMGARFDIPIFSNYGKASFEYLGFLSLDETLDELSRVDMAYLPYSFEESFARAAQVCFPDKLSTYLSAGCPVFYHGPKDSSVTRFIEKYSVGATCHSLEPLKIAAALKPWIQNPDRIETAKSDIEVALNEELNAATFRRNLASILGCSEDELIQRPERGIPRDFGSNSLALAKDGDTSLLET